MRNTAIRGTGAAAGALILALALAGCGGTHHTVPERPSPTGAQDESGDDTGADAADSGGTLGALNTALLKQDKDKFVRAFGPQLQAKAQEWWTNMKSLGMTTGGADSGSGDLAAASGSGEVRIGVHTSYDPVDVHGNPDLTLARYAVTISDGKITGWDPTTYQGPWDEGPLYVRRGPHLALAAPAADRAAVDSYFDDAQTAADWNVKMMRKFAPKLLVQKGFVAFLATNTSHFNSWFRAPNSGAGASGVREADGSSFSLPSVRLSESESGGKKFGRDSVGGARVVLSSEVAGGHARVARVSSHEFAHSLMSSFGIIDVQQDKWVTEGFARWWDTSFTQRNGGNGNSYPHSDTGADIRSIVRSGRFGAKPPKNSEFASLANAGPAYDYASSVYEFITERVGVNAAMVACARAYDEGRDPFAFVPKKIKPNGDAELYPASQMRQEWRSWQKKIYG
ncbi:hypothetical protein [Streptomyces sp. NPDC048650]|uniref:hypothetical protein n=1 Tax=unclassified Streptomyces TaxID=2593676 RepID=UPI0037119B7A